MAIADVLCNAFVVDVSIVVCSSGVFIAIVFVFVIDIVVSETFIVIVISESVTEGIFWL